MATSPVSSNCPHDVLISTALFTCHLSLSLVLSYADECGSCTTEMCHPGASDFETWVQRSMDEAVKRRAPVEALSSASSTVEDAPPPPPPRSSTPATETRSLLLCPDDPKALKNGLQSLPVLKRFCRRAIERCAKVRAALAWHMENVQPEGGMQTRPAILHRERPRVGAGYAHVLQEHAQLLMLAIVLARPLLIHADAEVFNLRGALLGPGPQLAARLYRPLDSLSVGYATFFACRAAKERSKLSEESPLPYKCRRADGGREGDHDGDERGTARWLLALDDGDAWSVLNRASLKSKWNRFTHATTPGPLAAFIPRGAVLFASPSVAAMYMSDFVAADSTLDVGKRNHRASVPQLTDGATDLSGPSCLLRSMIERASEPVLKTVVHALAPTAPSPGANDEGAVLVGVHIRRGDSRMQAECVECVNGDDPDVKSKGERIDHPTLRRQLGCVNASLGQIASTTGRAVFAFVASDTAEALAMAQEAIGAGRVLHVPGTAFHSTRPQAGASNSAGQVAADGTAPADVKIAADFLGLSIADAHFGLGDSSFLGNAAAAGMGTIVRAGDRVASKNACRALTPVELGHLKAAIAQPGTVLGKVQHVEL